ncbi:MAG TPA: glycosyl hydrolase family 65 protein [Acidimicrobiales bacterium]|nr:glycosyl hydrolase family 65 protein [Acidimicrobiales bacterium]
MSTEEIRRESEHITGEGQRIFSVEPWAVTEEGLHLGQLANAESVFALSNGHIGLRGNLDEGEPHGVPGTYLNSFYELRPLQYGERGYGYSESGQTIINVTNGKVFRLLVDDEPFDVRYGSLESHRRRLDLRAGTLERHVQWRSPAGDRVRVHSTRLVSLTQRAVAAIEYEVEPLDGPLRIVVQSELVANEQMPDLGPDPRTAAVLERPLVNEEHAAWDTEALMVHHTRQSGLRMASAMRHVIDGPDNTEVDNWSSEDVCRLTVATRLRPGERLRVVKLLSYGWSARRTRPALHDQVVAALAAARLTGWDGLRHEQRSYLDDFWHDADVELEGDAEVQQAVRFGLFHLLQAAARTEQRPIPGKGLTGPGYDGHTFWDTETFVLPVLTYTRPRLVADALHWRKITMPVAESRAEELGLEGAAFPWRTIRGRESSGYWPASTAAFHINADIADAAVRYLDATQDEAFERDVAFDLMVSTARLWRSLGHHDRGGAFRIDGVTGPDEYTAIVDNNVYTNLMARQNLRAAADLASRHDDLAHERGVSTEETASWRDAADAMVVPYDADLGVHPQNEGFTNLARWDFTRTGPDDYPLLLHRPYFDLYRKQVVKQPDLVLALHLRGEDFTFDDKDRNFRYYEGITVRDSSLSACTQSVVAAELGYLELAYDYLAEAALMDLEDRNRNTRDGLHMASLAGAWTALVEGLGGMRARGGRLWFAPRLPSDLGRLRFRVRYRGSGVEVETDGRTATYRLWDGEPLTVHHEGRPFRLGRSPVERPVTPIPFRDRPVQPPGREPERRGPRP